MRDETGEQLSLLMEQPEPPFRIHASNRLETLADRLAARMRRVPADPLEPERIVVSDPLMGEWLRLELASRLGVAAHLRIEQPAEFAWAAMREAVENLTGQSVYGPPHLRWRIFDRLASWKGQDEIGRYVGDGDARERFELADRLAVAYDRCRVYRPESIRQWQQGADDGWHARLWADLAAADAEPQHWVDAIDRYRDTLEGRPAPTPRKHVSFFHVAAMSPTYVETLRLAATVMDVHLYLLSPSRRFWSDPATRESAAPANELLDAWGRSARDLRELLQDEPGGLVVDGPAARDMPDGATCLAALQRDVLDAGANGGSAGREPRRPDDSIQVHVCHSPTREIEVLHDRLLGIFDQHPEIQPADVLLLTPDLDTYAPLVEAVFGSAGRIGFHIGRQRLKEGAALAAFLDLLGLPGSRYAASEVLAPLLAEPVRARFGVSDSDLATIRGAVGRSRIRWGIDGTHRTGLDVPASENHNWRRGLDRLVLGYAMAEENGLVRDIAPSPLDRWGFHAGAGDYELLGRFRRYCELVFSLDEWLAAEHKAGAWTERLRTDVLEPFFSNEPRLGPEAVREVNAVSRLIDEFDDECGRAGADGPIPFPVLRDVLAGHAAKAARSAPRLAEGVAVAELASGRIFPAKVICAAGMNDGAFPRRPGPGPFDFQAALFEGAARRPGDRDQRDEDRFAFLEALLAARRCLVVTCTGRDVQENRPIPPSVVVTELTDCLTERFPGLGPQPGDRWTTEHPLQPFSREYFRPGRPDLFSYSDSMLKAARALGAGGEAPLRFEGEVAAEEPGERPVELELEDLVRFAASPSKHFLRHRLGMTMETREDEVENDEPLDLNALEAWQLKSDMAATGERDDKRTIELAAARGLLPAANLGRVQHRQSAAQVAELERELQKFREHRDAPAFGLEVDFGDVRLVGAVERFHSGRNELLFWRIGSLRAKDRIATWLRLLALISGRGEAAAAELRGGRDKLETVTLAGPAPADARALLDDWIEAWRASQRRPLPFFAHTSWTWTRKSAWDSATEAAWSRQPWSEGNDAGHRLIFGADPCDEEFERLAGRLLGPLREASS